MKCNGKPCGENRCGSRPALTWVSGMLIGEYSTQDKALKVLDRIEELIENQCGLTFYMPADDEVVTVKKRIDYA